MTASTTITDFIEIVGGPTAHEVWDSAQHAHMAGFTVQFRGMRHQGHVKQHVMLTMQITGVEHEDGSGVSFKLKGNVTNVPDDQTYHGVKVFYYNAHTHRGTLDLITAS